MRLPHLPAEGEPITQVWGAQVVALLRSLIPQSTEGTGAIQAMRTPNGTTYRAVLPRQRASAAAEPAQLLDFTFESNGDGTTSDEGVYNNNGTWTFSGGWILTPRGPRRIAGNDSGLQDSDFSEGTAEAPKVVYIEATAPEMNDGALKTATREAFAALDASKLRVPIAEIGKDGTGTDAMPTIYRYCRTIMAVAFNAPEDAG